MKEKINQINKQVLDSISDAVKAVERIFSKTSERLNPILYQEKVGTDLVSVLTAFVKGKAVLLAGCIIGLNNQTVILNSSFAKLKEAIKMVEAGTFEDSNPEIDIEAFFQKSRIVSPETSIYDKMIKLLVSQPDIRFVRENLVSRKELLDFALMAYPDEYEKAKQSEIKMKRAQELADVLFQYPKRDVPGLKFPAVSVVVKTSTLQIFCPACGYENSVHLEDKERITALESVKGKLDGRRIFRETVIAKDLPDSVLVCPKCGFDHRKQKIFGKNLEDVYPELARIPVKSGMTIRESQTKCSEELHFVQVERVPSFSNMMLIRLYCYNRMETRIEETHRLFSSPDFSCLLVRQDSEWLCRATTAEDELEEVLRKKSSSQQIDNDFNAYPLQEDIAKSLNQFNRMKIQNSLFLQQENDRWYLGKMWFDGNMHRIKKSAALLFEILKKSNVEHLFPELIGGYRNISNYINTETTASQVLERYYGRPIPEKAIKVSSEKKLDVNTTCLFSLFAEEITLEEFLEFYNEVSQSRDTIICLYEIHKFTKIPVRKCIEMIMHYSEQEAESLENVCVFWKKYVNLAKLHADPELPMALDDTIRKRQQILNCVVNLTDDYLYDTIPTLLKSVSRGKYTMRPLEYEKFAGVIYLLCKENNKAFAKIRSFCRDSGYSQFYDKSLMVFAVKSDNENLCAIILLKISKDGCISEIVSNGSDVPSEVRDLANMTVKALKDGYSSLHIEQK